MKKINYKKVFIALLWVAILAGLSASLGFVSKKEKNITVNNVSVMIHNNEENYFLNEKEIKNFISEHQLPLLNQKFSKIKLSEIENVLDQHPAIENAEVSSEMNGNVKIEVWQRTPMLRIINRGGESYYIDNNSKLMPLNTNYTARVLVASGDLYEPFSRRKMFSVKQMERSKLYSDVTMLDDVYELAKFIEADSSLNFLIQQIYVNKEKDIELFPSIGNHKIILGTIENMQEKLNKLKLFYTEGLNKSDSWRKYSSINLKYKNLVVCTKK